VFPGFSQSTAAFALTIILAGMIFSLMSILFFTHATGKDEPQKVVPLVIGIFCALMAILISAISSIFEAMVVILFLIWRRKDMYKYQTVTYTGLVIGSLIVPIIFQRNNIHLSPAVMISSIRQWMEGYLIIWRTIVVLPTGGSKIFIYLFALIVLFIILLFVFRVSDKDTLETKQDLRKLWIALLVSAGCGFVLILYTEVLNSKSGLNLTDSLDMAVIGLAISVFIVSLIKLLFLDNYQSVILAMIIVLAGGARFQMIDRFAQETRDVDDFLSQLQVRVDGFKPGTSLLVEQLPFNNTTRIALQALIRDRFGISQSDSELQLVPADDTSVREFLMNGELKQKSLRIDNKQVEISKDRVLAVFFPKNGCIRLLEPGEVMGEMPYGLKLASKYSNSLKINVNNLSDVLQLNKFRTTIEKDICYENQLIHRYSAQKSWEDVVNTYAKLPEGSQLQDDMSIGKPVLQAMINTGDIREALNLTNELKNFENYKETICPIWTAALTDSSLSKEVNTSLTSAIPETGCP
jgi:hypothetical protein